MPVGSSRFALTKSIVSDTLHTMDSEVEQDVGALAVALRRINHVLDSHSRRQKVLLGLTAPQMLTLAAISHCEEPPSVTQLSRLVSLSQATMTGITLRLSASGLVERKRDVRDGRRTVIQLTDQGSKALQTAASLMPRRFLEQFSALSASKRRRMLGAVVDLAALLVESPIQTPKDPCVDSTEKSVLTASDPKGAFTKGSTAS